MKGAIILEAGREFDLKQVGARAYSSAATDSGWLPCPMPAIYSDERMRPYREWLPANNFDSITSLGGSFVSDRIEDYYFTPWDLDYGRLIRFDHDFVGREALETMATQTHRRKVSLVLHPDDVAAVLHSQMSPGQNAKWMELPTPHYSSYPYDSVRNAKGDHIGVSMFGSFLAPDKAMVMLAVVDEEYGAEGTDLTIIWGEPNGGSKRPTVERHVQMQIRATVSGWPFSQQARSGYRPG